MVIMAKIIKFNLNFYQDHTFNGRAHGTNSKSCLFTASGTSEEKFKIIFYEFLNQNANAFKKNLKNKY